MTTKKCNYFKKSITVNILNKKIFYNVVFDIYDHSAYINLKKNNIFV